MIAKKKVLTISLLIATLAIVTNHLEIGIWATWLNALAGVSLND